jgi:hypothetical protein
MPVKPAPANFTPSELVPVSTCLKYSFFFGSDYLGAGMFEMDVFDWVIE